MFKVCVWVSESWKSTCRCACMWLCSHQHTIHYRRQTSQPKPLPLPKPQPLSWQHIVLESSGVRDSDLGDSLCFSCLLLNFILKYNLLLLLNTCLFKNTLSEGNINVNMCNPVQQNKSMHCLICIMLPVKVLLISFAVGAWGLVTSQERAVRKWNVLLLSLKSLVKDGFQGAIWYLPYIFPPLGPIASSQVVQIGKLAPLGKVCQVVCFEEKHLSIWYN